MHDIVQDYYGKQLKSSGDLKTTACCDLSQIPQRLKPLLARIHPEVLSRYYGCGLVCPTALEGCRVLDLGCGSGRDVYALAQLVGPRGEVVGVEGCDRSGAPAHRLRVEGLYGLPVVKPTREPRRQGRRPCRSVALPGPRPQY
jgi:SAM-dependent methyltransferase